jgi:putative ABC transport system permease protein
MENSDFRRLAVGVLRMVAQVGVLSALFVLLWHYDSVWLNLLWLLLLTAMASWVLVRRTGLAPKVMLLPVGGGMLVAVLPVTLLVLWIVTPLMLSQAGAEVGLLNARWFIPVSGVLLAQVLVSGIRGLNDYFHQLHTNNLPYYQRIGSGGSRIEALRPYVVHALAAMADSAASQLSVVALFAVPMLLSGMLLGGLKPIVAGVAFVVLAVAGVIASAVFLVVAVWLADRRIFDRRGELKDAENRD